jgi:RNA polymerase sigma factor (sigma-70 family)
VSLEYQLHHQELVERCINGDRRAQFELYQLYSKAMFNICFRMMGNREEAEDVLQNAFIDIFMKLDTFQFKSTVGAWIKRIVINNCINELKKRKMAFEELDEIQTKEQMKFVDLHEDDLNVDHIKEAILQLPDGYRTVFTLYLMEGYDHQEIASILNITEGASKSQYSRAKERIRKWLYQKSKTG